jgi:hypothetical protein
MRDDDDAGIDAGDDALRGIDLDAWAPPPPPPAGALADAVVARMREPVPSSAREPEGRGVRRRWTIAAAAAAAVALAAGGVLAIARWGTSRPPAGGHGEVFAARASHLPLGPSSAELDPGAEVRWRRDGRRIEAAQPRGRVLWRAGGEDTLVIDAGAAVASVEATGASLRVEVQMNLSDVRTMGASAVTAAAVALVTVIVYQGHVKVTSAGQTVNVEPGGVIELRPRESAREAPTVGAATPAPSPAPAQSVDEMKREMRELQKRILEAEQAIAAQEEEEDEPPPAPGRCDAGELADKGRDAHAVGQYAASLRYFEQAYACKPEPSLAQKAVIVACNLPSVAKARHYWKRLPGTMRQRILGVCVRNAITEDMLNAAAATLKVTSRPPSTVFIDDEEIGRTPVEIEIPAGRHRVRFELGTDRYTFTVNARAGETVTLDKALQ